MSDAQVSGDSTGFAFTGKGSEYFRIWIVNLLLTVVTLGIYSAWAKVRREQYFHRNTLLAGSGFDYHGSPLAILKGRVIAVGLLLVLGTAQKFSPGLYLALVLGSLPFLPWLMVRSLRFRAGNTAYRGLRFHHRGTYREALTAYVGHGLLTLVTFGLWMPMWARAVKQFQIDKLSFGDADFACRPRAGGYYGAYLQAGLLAVVPLAIAPFLFWWLTSSPQGGSAAPNVILVAVLGLVLALLAIALLVRPFIQVRLTNLTWNAATLGARRFSSTQALRSFWPLHATNLLLIALTVGLYWPWAKVREAAYRAEHFAVEAADLDDFVAQARPQASAVGEEIVDVFDLDVAL